MCWSERSDSSGIGGERRKRVCAQHTAQESSNLDRPPGPGRDPRGRQLSRGPGGHSGGCTRWAPPSWNPQPLLTPEACFQRTQTPNFGLRVTPQKWPDTQRRAGGSPGVPRPHIRRASPGWSQGASNWGLDRASAQGVPLSLSSRLLPSLSRKIQASEATRLPRSSGRLSGNKGTSADKRGQAPSAGRRLA